MAGVGEHRGRLDSPSGPCRSVPEHKRRSSTRPDKAAAPIPDRLGRDFNEAINQRWCGDLTEIPIGEDKLYLATVEDLASRRLPGFAIGEHHDAALARAALC